MTHRLATNCAKNYCNRTPVVKVIVENVFWGDTVYMVIFIRNQDSGAQNRGVTRLHYVAHKSLQLILNYTVFVQI